MRLSFTDSHLAISKKLGWDAMPAIVAIPAIDKIVNTAIDQRYEIMHNNASFECIANALIDRWSSDEIFALLIDDAKSSLTPYMKKMFISLRCKIEDEMMSGSSYQEAIHEWFK
jgi:hypothetical protein